MNEKPFWDKSEARLIRRTLETRGQELRDAAGIYADQFQDPHLGAIWKVIIESQKPGWNPDLDLYSPENIKQLGGQNSKAWEDLIALATLSYPEFMATIHLAREFKEEQKTHLKRKLQYDLEAKETFTPQDIQRFRETLDALEKPAELTRETTPLEDKLAWIDSLRTPKKLIPTGYPSINELFEGFRNSSFYVLAGRTGNGKTSVALNLARTLENTRTIFYSLEMKTDFMHERLAKMETNEEGLTREPSIETLERLAANYAKEDLDQIKFAEIPYGGMNIDQLKADIKRRKLLGEIDIVFIDQLDNIAKPEKFINDTERLSHYSATLRQLARDLDLPIVLLAQINREGNEEPQLVHLKQTGQLEQDAAVVFLVQIKDHAAPTSELVFKVAKNRYGRTGKVFMSWQGKFQKLEEKTRQGYAEAQIWQPGFTPSEIQRNYTPAGTAF
jgi:replicative DNA helicase